MFWLSCPITPQGLGNSDGFCTISTDFSIQNTLSHRPNLYPLRLSSPTTSYPSFSWKRREPAFSPVINARSTLYPCIFSNSSRAA